MSRNWYVLHINSGYEKRIETSMNNLIHDGVLPDSLFQVKVPERDIAEIKNGKKKIRKEKLYPGYVLLEMDIDKNKWKEIYSVIKNVTGVTGFVGADKTRIPFPLSSAEVKAMLQTSGDAKGDTFVKQKVDFKHGETVKITDGPFITFSGTVEDINLERNKVRVMVNIFGRSTPVELDFNQVEKI